jgi:hypothetical protein
VGGGGCPGGQELEGRFTKWNNNAGGVRAHDCAAVTRVRPPAPPQAQAVAATAAAAAAAAAADGGDGVPPALPLGATVTVPDPSRAGPADVVAGLARLAVSAAATAQPSLQGLADGLGPSSGCRLEIIGEDSDGEDLDGEDSDSGDSEATGGFVGDEEEEAGVGDVPQCFSHFTYQATEGRQLVCDLQVPPPPPHVTELRYMRQTARFSASERRDPHAASASK